MADRMDALTVREDEKSGKSYWTRIGVAFQNKDGGWTIRLDALPVNGKIVLRLPRERTENPGSGSESGW